MAYKKCEKLIHKITGEPMLFLDQQAEKILVRRAKVGQDGINYLDEMFDAGELTTLAEARANFIAEQEDQQTKETPAPPVTVKVN